MKIKEISHKENNIYKAFLYGNRGESFPKKARIFIDGEKYIVELSRKVTKEPLDRTFEVILLKVPQTTKYNYDHVNFIYVEWVQRTDPYTVEVIGDLRKTISTFDDPKECLQEFLALRQIHKEALSSVKRNYRFE